MQKESPHEKVEKQKAFVDDHGNCHGHWYGGETYNSDPGNAGKLTVTGVTENKTVDLYYSITQAPEKSEVTVNHIYRTITYETVEVTDPETGEVTGTETIDTVKEDSREQVIQKDLYIGAEYTAAQQGKEGYTFNEELSDDPTATVQANGATVINLYYDQDESVDDCETATINVQHIYTTYLTTIEDGKVQIQKVVETVNADTVTGKAGDVFTAETETTYHDEEYTVVGTPDLDVVLQPGTNSTIIIHYKREASNLVETSYTVNYVYKTYTMTVVDGVAQYGEPVVETVNGEVQSGSVGEIVTIDSGNREGFQPVGENPATEQTLKADANVFTFTYAKYIPLAQVNVTVNHHYTTTTIAVNGEPVTETVTTAGVPVSKYVNETCVAAAAANGYTYDSVKVTEGIANTQDETTKNVTVTASGNVVVDFYYSKTVDNSKPVSYSIQHVYVTIHWDGTRTVDREEPITGTSYATKQISAATDDNGGNFHLTSAYFNDEVLPGFDSSNPQSTYAVTLVDGENVIVYTYERTVDTREATQVKVIHNYYARDTYTVDEALTDAEYIAQEGVEPEYRTETVYDSFDDGIWVGNSYTAILYDTVYFQDENGLASIARNYELVNANPVDGEVNPIAKLNDDNTIPDGNVVTYDLIREYSADPGDITYNVVHEYYTNGSLSGRNTTTGTGKVGDVVNAADINKVTTFEGNTYNFTSASTESITLSDGDNTITFRYDRTTGGGGGGTTSYYKVTVHYLDADGNEIANSYVTPSIREGGSWDVSDKQLENITVGDATYTFAYADGDDLAGSNIRSDKVVSLYYEAETDIEDGETPLNPDPGEEVEIPDEETPLGPGPEEEADIPEEETPLAPAPEDTTIDDGEVPLASLPQTGAAIATVNPAITAGMLTLAAAMLAAGVVYTIGRKKEDDPR